MGTTWWLWSAVREHRGPGAVQQRHRLQRRARVCEAGKCTSPVSTAPAAGSEAPVAVPPPAVAPAPEGAPTEGTPPDATPPVAPAVPVAPAATPPPLAPVLAAPVGAQIAPLAAPPGAVTLLGKDEPQTRKRSRAAMVSGIIMVSIGPIALLGALAASSSQQNCDDDLSRDYPDHRLPTSERYRVDACNAYSVPLFYLFGIGGAVLTRSRHSADHLRRQKCCPPRRCQAACTCCRGRTAIPAAFGCASICRAP